MHGGAWIVGGMEDRIIASSLQRLLDNKIAVVCVGYRFLADAEADGVFPPVAAPMQDCLDAVNFVKANAEKWNIDASKLALSGGSAGACSALYCALADNCAIGAKAVCVFVPQTSLDPKQMREWISNINYGARAYGCKNLDEALQKRAKLLPYIEKYSPAALLEKCDAKKAPVFAMQFNEDIANTKPSKDPVHSAKFGVNFKKLCDAKGVECEVYTSQKFEGMFDRAIKALK